HDLPRVTLVGSSHSEHSTDEWRSIVREGLAGAALDEDEVEDLVARAAWHTADATDADDLRALFETAREAAGPDAAPVLYFALGPGITREAAGALAGFEDLPDGLRLALEKPFGEDEESAR
ncbi:glucose-6-phosphate dehydrogenase, partial [Xanthomonas citri pv. citri]|nr:glucose-6-phosphate dehydrogenase [Xanthomonas citri pv. citri]